MADQITTTTSKQFSINLSDFWKGLLVATLTTPITTLIDSLNAGTFTIDWKHLGIVALSGLLAYILKNFFQPSQTIVKPAPSPGTQVIDVPPAGETKK